MPAIGGKSRTESRVELTSVTKYLGTTPLVTSYGYDELGNRISQTDANQHTTTYAYDQLGRRSSRTLPMGMGESYTGACPERKRRNCSKGKILRLAALAQDCGCGLRRPQSAATSTAAPPPTGTTT
jgi:YD repeat-containing protein